MQRLIVFAAALAAARCKVYDRCELARELRDRHEIPEKQIGTWVCIARYESEFNTAAVNKDSGDHGLFQISQLFWCSPGGHACGVSCKDLRDDDIEDDVICARRIYREHKRLSGDGFNAWVVYRQRCQDQNHVRQFVEGCFDAKSKFGSSTTSLNRLSTVSPNGLSTVSPNRLSTASLIRFSTASPNRLSTSGFLTSKSSFSTKRNFEFFTSSSSTLRPFKAQAVGTTAKTVGKHDPNYTYSISKTGFKITKT